MDFVLDSMTASNWMDLDERSGELGATWDKCDATPSARFYIFDNKVHCGVVNSGAGAAMYASGIPPSADYGVSCDYTVKTNVGHVGIAGRMSTTKNTYYFVYYDPQNVLVLARRVNGVITILGNNEVGVMSAGGTYQLDLLMTGAQIQAVVNEEVIYDVTDPNPISAAGRAGVRSGSVNDAHIGKHIDNFRAFDFTTPTPVPTSAPRSRSFISSGV